MGLQSFIGYIIKKKTNCFKQYPVIVLLLFILF